MKMEGVDRHLLGLKLAHRELASQDPTLKLPQLFKEQFHDYFSEILLSTSQVSTFFGQLQGHRSLKIS